MRLRFLAALTAFSLSTGMAFASPSSAAAGSGAKVTGGVLAAGGGVGAAYAVSNLFRTQNKREVLVASRAPEISTTGTTAGLVLLVGGILVLRGRQRTVTCAE